MPHRVLSEANHRSAHDEKEAERPQPGAAQRRRKTRVLMISHSIRAVTLATLFAVTMFAAGTSALAASFDGPWSVTVVTRSGPCDPSYRYGVTISRGVVYYAGGGPVNLTGRVSPSGSVTVRVSSGPQYAIGSGRLSRSAGGGSWRGQGPNGACAGVWSASRG
jgi:hypothetical protein